MNNNFKRYIVFWISQALSQLGGFMTSFALCLRMLVGEGAGSGMAVMLLCTGVLGALFSFYFYQKIRRYYGTI